MQRLLLCLGLLALLVAPALATVVVPAEFREIVTESSLIVRGRVTATTAARTQADEVSTVATVQVAAVLKGQADAFVSVVVPGGRVGRVRTVMVGAPRFAVNDAAVFFLSRGGDGLWRPVGLSSGVFRILPDPVTGSPQIRPPVFEGQTATRGPVVRGDRQRKPLTVSEFDALVRVAQVPISRRVARGRTR